MSILLCLLYIVEIGVALMLALVVMLQKPKEGGLGGAIGGGMLESTLGADAGNVLIKATSILGGIFLANTLLLAVVLSHRNSNSLMVDEDSNSVVSEIAPELPVPQTPQVPSSNPAPAQQPLEPPAGK